MSKKNKVVGAPERELTDEQWDALNDRIMSLPGIDKKKESFLEMEIVDKDEVFLKFMSDGGKTDNSNGSKLHAMLEWANVKHEFFDDRKFFVKYEALEAFLNGKGV